MSHVKLERRLFILKDCCMTYKPNRTLCVSWFKQICGVCFTPAMHCLNAKSFGKMILIGKELFEFKNNLGNFFDKKN